ncbi:MAG: hypothetical protein GY751_13750 [Bacteroidetes bacterium]|nr:hypothetical protein [Bacteroidota bacterium]
MIIPGTSTGTITDFDGNYTLGIPSDENQLHFRYVGFNTSVA